MVSFVARFVRIETGESGEDEDGVIFLGPDNTRYWMPLRQCGSVGVRKNLKVNQYYIVTGEIDGGFWWPSRWFFLRRKATGQASGFTLQKSHRV